MGKQYIIMTNKTDRQTDKQTFLLLDAFQAWA